MFKWAKIVLIITLCIAALHYPSYAGSEQPAADTSDYIDCTIPDTGSGIRAHCRGYQTVYARITIRNERQSYLIKLPTNDYGIDINGISGEPPFMRWTCGDF
jgi:hypothetical protein